MKRIASGSRLAPSLAGCVVAAGWSLWCAAAVAGNQAAFLAVTGYPAHARAVPMLAVATHPPPTKPPANADARQSGASFMSAATQALQNDDRQNPAMLWIAGGEMQWQTPAGKASRSCASCHGDAKQSMRGAAARYPAFDSKVNQVITLAQRIAMCRQGAQQGAPLAPESDDLLSLEAYVGMQSRGMPMAPPGDDATRAAAERGRLRWQQRVGQLNLSCAQCHDERAGRSLAGSTIPEGHVNGYPTYRLEWQGLGSLQRRLRNCLSGVRAEPPPFNSTEMVELELYLAQRSAGMKIETPAVRP